MISPKTHFLIVNDEPTKRRIIVALLKELNFTRVSEAADGITALKAFHLARTMNAPIDFMITGCKMPFVNGLELIRTLRTQEYLQDLPVLMITDSATQKNIIDAVEAGADGYLVRPFKASHLLKQIETIAAVHALREPGSRRMPVAAGLPVSRDHHVHKFS